MERLTRHQKEPEEMFGFARCSNYEVFPYLLKKKAQKVVEDVLKRLAHYEDLEERGEFIIAPATVGDKLWQYDPKFDEALPVLVESIGVNIEKDGVVWSIRCVGADGSSGIITPEDIGKTLFWDREEAVERKAAVM